MNETGTASGVGFFSLLGIVFVVLKLTHVISWSWLWVLAPFWLPLAVVFILALIIYIVTAVTGR